MATAIWPSLHHRPGDAHLHLGWPGAQVVRHRVAAFSNSGKPASRSSHGAACWRPSSDTFTLPRPGKPCIDRRRPARGRLGLGHGRADVRLARQRGRMREGPGRRALVGAGLAGGHYTDVGRGRNGQQNRPRERGSRLPAPNRARRGPAEASGRQNGPWIGSSQLKVDGWPTWGAGRSGIGEAGRTRKVPLAGVDDPVPGWRPSPSGATG